MTRLLLNINANKAMRFRSALITTQQNFIKPLIRSRTGLTRRSLSSAANRFQSFPVKNKLLSNCVPLFRTLSTINESIIKISDELEKGLAERRPMVALESTIITHGMPFPINLETAQRVERIVREEGVIPATVGVLNGQIRVGLSEEELEYLARESQSGTLSKISRSDLPFVVANQCSGGTTVSATSLIASRCGIDIFVTGGIGGVHRGVEHTLDISADLTELGKTPIAVVCAGVKSILDIPKTLEFLETQGVCVMVLNGDQYNEKEVEFPAFFTRNSGSRIAYNADTTEKVAKVIARHKALGLDSGIVIAVPIPAQNQSVGQSVDNAINEALSEVKSKGISGKKVTPYVLERVNQLSRGSSLTANIALIENNARVGARIAVQLRRLLDQESDPLSSSWKRANSLHSDSRDTKITNGGNHSSELSKAGRQSIPELNGREPIEHNGHPSEELSPVRRLSQRPDSLFV